MVTIINVQVLISIKVSLSERGHFTGAKRDYEDPIYRSVLKDIGVIVVIICHELMPMQGLMDYVTVDGLINNIVDYSF